ncbi:uncharacterized protein A1O5_04088 [Cladophialophora psammophila CBS 110553]|uniref:Uncharacterized protein n=1 Tax=Cladophialophora psammophila CBS 110553 TaxID=1182543 RepID=W9XRM1_9EURO|nr:uncharacterized protein A1O5_04088 [Cladophialophora psammophila CBS 110553]EXJ72939.1 hypothetical protein A1O5_04088 [Cladophialophora psammophila CBS 110553]
MVAALSGGTVPIGATVEPGQDVTVKCDGRYPETRVWAAQYQLINSMPVLRVEGDEAIPINYIEVCPDYTYTKGKVLGDEDDQDEAFELEVEPVDEEEIDVDGFDGGYWEAYREAEEMTKKLNGLTDANA